jgi:GWxTD domain-containing protein
MLARTTTEQEDDAEERLEAHRALVMAIDLDPRNRDYLEEYGQFRVGLARTEESDSLLARYLDNLRHGSPAERELRAYMYYNLGLIEERNYERYRNKYMTQPGRTVPSTAMSPNPSPFLGRYVNSYLGSSSSIPGSGLAIKERIQKNYRTALRYNPDHIGAATRMLLYHLEDNTLSEYLALARHLADSQPDQPVGDLYLGLGLHASGREEEAGEAYDRALAAMSPTQRSPFLDLEQVLRRRPAKEYRELDEGERTDFERIFWRLTDPLFLTDANERRLEHFSRVAYADLRFSEPATGRRGWDTERGIIFIRYGPPSIVARYDAFTHDIVLWTYVGGPAFMFRQTHGYYRTNWAGDYKWIMQEARHHQPAVYANIPSISLMFELPVQIARFRGDSPDDLAVEIHSELPLELLAGGMDLEESEFETGIFLLNTKGERIVEEKKTEVLTYTDASAKNPLRSWRLHLPAAGTLVAAVETRDAVSWRAAAARDTFTASFFTEDSLSISDILFADNIRLLSQKPERRSDYDIAANPARRYVPDQPVHIYYELYGLDRDPEGFASYEVSLSVTVKSLTRDTGPLAGDNNPLIILGVLADAWGFSIVGDDRLELRFSRELDMTGRDRATEYHSLDLNAAPPGEYEITLKVYDNLLQRLAGRTRVFRVVAPGSL